MRFDEAQVVQDILEAVPETIEIWFHGSRARGDHKRNSDYDVLVICPDDMDPYSTYERLKPLNPPRRLDDTKRAELDIQSAPVSDKERSASVAYWAAEEGRLLFSRPELEAEAAPPSPLGP